MAQVKSNFEKIYCFLKIKYSFNKSYFMLHVVENSLKKKKIQINNKKLRDVTNWSYFDRILDPHSY